MPRCRGAAQPPGHLLPLPPLFPSPSRSHVLSALPTTLIIMALKAPAWLVAEGGGWGRGGSAPATFNWPETGPIHLAAEAGGLTGSPPSQEENVQKDDVP